jgi:hypothetical protein
MALAVDALAFSAVVEHRRREWLNRVDKITIAPLEVRGSACHPAHGAPISPALECRSIKAMVRSCQCSSEVAILASKSGHRVDPGLTREVENEN